MERPQEVSTATACVASLSAPPQQSCSPPVSPVEPPTSYAVGPTVAQAPHTDSGAEVPRIYHQSPIPSFFNVILSITLLSCPDSPPWPPPHSTPLPQAVPAPSFTSTGQVCEPFGGSIPILDLTSPWLFWNHLLVLLNPLSSSPIPTPPPIWEPSGN